MTNAVTTASTLQTTDTNPMKAALMALAASCIQNQRTDWFSPDGNPFEELVTVVGGHVTDAEDEAAQASGPVAVASMLLGVREKLH